MKGYNSKTDWSRNKNSAAIIYVSADGSITEITLESFLADSPKNTVEMFQELKALSDELYQAEDNAEGSRAKNELPLYEWSADCATESPESMFVDAPDEETVKVYFKRRQQMLNLVPEILDKLTDIQRRRFLLHKVKLLSTRKIAAREGTTQQAISKSIVGAEKKIEKYLLNLKQKAAKRVVTQED